MKFKFYYLAIILAPILQMAFAASNQAALVNWELINITAIFLIVSNKKLAAMFLLIGMNTFSEIINQFPLVGLTAFCFFAAYLIWELLFKYLVFFGRDRRFTNLALTFITALIFDHIIRSVVGLSSNILEVNSLLLNLGSFIVIYLIYKRLEGPQNAFKS